MIISLRGVLSIVFSVFGVFLFSISLLFSENLVFFWLFLELVGLSLIPAFFYNYSDVSFYNLFVYIIVSSFSSSFMLLGILNYELMFFFVLGYLIKFGVFPFFSWVYNIVLGSNGVVVFLLSTFAKVPFIFICFFLTGLFLSSYNVIIMFCILSFLVLSGFFWIYNYNWRCCWCHMMLSSSAALVLMSFSSSTSLLIWLFLFYVVWSTLTIFFLFFCEGSGFDLNYSFSSTSVSFSLVFWFGFIFLLLTTPVSLSLFYKIFMSFCIYSCGWVVILFWVLYSLSEQFFFLKYLVSSYISKFYFNWFSL